MSAAAGDLHQSILSPLFLRTSVSVSHGPLLSTSPVSTTKYRHVVPPLSRLPTTRRSRRALSRWCIFFFFSGAWTVVQISVFPCARNWQPQIIAPHVFSPLQSQLIRLQFCGPPLLPVLFDGMISSLLLEFFLTLYAHGPRYKDAASHAFSPTVSVFLPVPSSLHDFCRHTRRDPPLGLLRLIQVLVPFSAFIAFFWTISFPPK